MRRVLLSIAGFDPSGGAGILLDTAIFRCFGFQGAAVLTAVTSQGPGGVRGVRPISPSALRSQFRALRKDLALAGIKVGMAATAGNLAAIGRILGREDCLPRVVDPIIRSSSGAWLLEKAAVSSFCKVVRGRASLLTPNLDEARRLTGRRVASVLDMEQAARELYSRTAIPCLIKGGHLSGEAVNVLFDGSRIRHFGKPRLRADVHGTGCFFSSAVLAFLAAGKSLVRSCEEATEATYRGLIAARSVGRGRRYFSI